MSDSNISAPPNFSSSAVIVVDDDEDVRMAIAAYLVSIGYEVVAVGSERQAFECLVEGRFFAAVVDICMPDRDGLELMDRIASHGIDCKVIAISGSAGRDVYLRAAACKGAYAILEKPFDPDLLAQVLTDIQAGRPVAL